MNVFKIYVRPMMVEYVAPILSPYTIQYITMVEDAQRSFTIGVSLVSMASSTTKD